MGLSPNLTAHEIQTELFTQQFASDIMKISPLIYADI